MENFDHIFDIRYTARMEEELDEIEDGKIDWRVAMQRVLRAAQAGPRACRAEHDRHQADGEAHRPHLREVRQAHGHQVGPPRQLHRLHGLSRSARTRARLLPESGEVTEGEEEYCENCGRPMVLKKGRFGQFYACSGYPDCKTTKQLGGASRRRPMFRWRKRARHAARISCSASAGSVSSSPAQVIRSASTRSSRRSVSSVRSARKARSSSETRSAARFYGCNRYPECDFAAWGKPIAEQCPKCSNPYLVEKWLKAGPVAQCPNPECKYKRDLPKPAPEEALAG